MGDGVKGVPDAPGHHLVTSALNQAATGAIVELSAETRSRGNNEDNAYKSATRRTVALVSRFGLAVRR